jgi:hypothetical protein
VTPTFVRTQTEKQEAERTETFRLPQPKSEFAKKAVIQQTKMEQARIVDPKIQIAPDKMPETAKSPEDKSASRKSTLNMKLEEAKAAEKKLQVDIGIISYGL